MLYYEEVEYRNNSQEYLTAAVRPQGIAGRMLSFAEKRKIPDVCCWYSF